MPLLPLGVRRTNSHACRLGIDATPSNRAPVKCPPVAPPCRLPGSSYSSSRRTWTLPVSSHDEVTAALEAVPGVRVRLEPLPKPALAVLQVGAARLDQPLDGVQRRSPMCDSSAWNGRGHSPSSEVGTPCSECRASSTVPGILPQLP